MSDYKPDYKPDYKSDAQPNAQSPLSNHDLELMADQAREERRLGLLILENKTGAALDAGVPHFRRCAELWENAGSPTRRAEVLITHVPFAAGSSRDRAATCPPVPGDRLASVFERHPSAHVTVLAHGGAPA